MKRLAAHHPGAQVHYLIEAAPGRVEYDAPRPNIVELLQSELRARLQVSILTACEPVTLGEGEGGE